MRLEPESTWGAPGDNARFVTRLLGRDRTLTMNVTTFEPDQFVHSTSIQPGLPDARHERVFERDGDAPCTASSSNTSREWTRSAARPTTAAPRHPACVRADVDRARARAHVPRRARPVGTHLSTIGGIRKRERVSVSRPSLRTGSAQLRLGRVPQVVLQGIPQLDYSVGQASQALDTLSPRVDHHLEQADVGRQVRR